MPVDLRQGSADGLPFDHDIFDAALAINSMQVWPDAMSGLREICRVIKPGGKWLWSSRRVPVRRGPG
jgi:ubiquinone/menaquinone biosynthesis C-methylase UbiE